MRVFQKEITITSKPRGFHLITNEILNKVPEINEFKIGIAHIFIKHTSASLTINENADPTVRSDMEKFFNKSVPEDADYFEHTLEGSDDMTSHIKSTIIGNSIIVPIKNGEFNLGTWQGIYLCEHRNFSRGRKLVVTIMGE